MSTAERTFEAPPIYDGTVAKSTATAGFTGIDPRRRRYGYHPGIYRMELEPTHSGQQISIIPGGILVPFRSARMASENFRIEVPIDEYHKQVIEDYDALWYINNCKVNYDNQGFRELPPLTMLEDAIREEDGRILFENFLKSPHGYFNQVHPSFQELGHICPAGLVNCVTCRVFFLGGDAELGGPPDVIQERIAKCPDPQIGEALREVLLDANVVLRDFYSQKWAVLMGEYEGRQKGEPGIGSFDDSLHHIRKHIHEPAPAERTALAAAGYGAQVAEAQAEGMRELAEAFRERPASNGNDDLLAAVLKTQQQQGEMLAQVGKGLSALLQERAAPKPTAEVAPSPAPAEKEE